MFGVCHFQPFWVGSNPTRNNFLRFLKQNITKGKNCEKIGKFRRNIGKSRRNIGIYREISEFIGKNRKKSGKIGQTKFLCIFLFEAHRKTIFRRNIGRKNRNFCPWIWEDMSVVDNKDILLLIIPFQVRGIPHSR